MEAKPLISLDKVQGMFMGAFLGDSLGAPHEFKCNAKVQYTGILEHRAFMTSQFQGKRELEVGQGTDDTELTLTLLRSLIADNGYNRENTITEYLEWANSGVWMMGKNTRALLKVGNLKNPMKGYQNRINKILALPEDQRTQSNGALMRCSSLALLWDNICVIEDNDITNPNPICRDCNLVYINSLRLALQGVDIMTILETAKIMAQTAEVKLVLEQIETRECRDITAGKGWCLHGLYCTFMIITSFDNYSEAMNWVITSQKGSDTDTNACIAGAMLGAIIGLDQMKTEPNTSRNIDILLNTNIDLGPTPRPAKYSTRDFYELMELAHKLTL